MLDALSRLALAVGRALCAHRGYIDDIRRVDVDRVECQCHRCGKNLVATYGLALRCRLERKP